MIFKLKTFLITCLLFLATSGFTQDNTFTLKQAQEYAITHNYQSINAVLDIEAAKKKVWETTAIGLPQVSVEAKFQNFIEIPTSLVPANSFNPNAPADEFAELKFGTDYNTTASISASQLIFDGSYIVGLQAAKTYKEFSINTKKKTEQEVKDAVAQAYHTVLVATENQRVLEQNYESVESLLDGTKKTYNEGLIEEQTVDQLQLNLINLKNSVNQAKRQTEIAEKLLKFQMGMDINQSIELTDNLKLLVENEDGAALLTQQFNFSNHIDYQLIQTNERLMKLNYRKEKYSFAPSIAAFFSHQQSNMSNDFDAFSGGKYYPTTLWGLSLKIPILTSGMRLAKMGQAKIEYEKSVTTSKQVEQSLTLKAQTAQSTYNSAYDTYLNQQQSLKLAKSIYDKMVKKFKEGTITSLELTQSQVQMLSTEGMYIKSILDLLNAKSALKKALGNN
jgi:outer membrane protein TolC